MKEPIMKTKIQILRINLTNLPGNLLVGAPLWSNDPIDWNPIKK